jgi:hypothetical protein
MQARHSANERAGVGMARTSKDISHSARFNDTPRIHHQHSLRDSLDEGEVVGNEKHTDAVRALHADQHIKHLCLNRNIESSRGLICNKQTRLPRERHCRHRSLLHPTAQFMRKGTRDTRGIQSYLAKKTLAFCCAVDAGAMCSQNFADLEPDRVQGVQSRRRLLKNVGNLTAAKFAQIAWRRTEHIHPAKKNCAADISRGRLWQ